MSGTVAYTIAPPEAGEHEPLRAILGHALHFPHAAMGFWFEGIGARNFRVVRAEGEVAGGLGILRLGQWYGGAVVPLAGIGAVGIAPEWRGRGAASALLRETLTELHAEGLPLAALYPSTLPVYRKAGFERAAQNTTYDIPLAILDTRAPLTIVRASPDDLDLRTVYTQAASRRNGALDRNPFIWHKTLAPYNQAARLSLRPQRHDRRLRHLHPGESRRSPDRARLGLPHARRRANAARLPRRTPRDARHGPPCAAARRSRSSTSSPNHAPRAPAASNCSSAFWTYRAHWRLRSYPPAPPRRPPPHR
ncbi:MAG: GNAT family N-acetyltransferase [Chloroflexia bacterium]